MILILCIILELSFIGYGKVVTKAEETKQNPHTLSNPSYDADGNVTWDCIWFGNCPQTEIISENDNTQLEVMKEMNIYYKTMYETVSMSAYQQIAVANYDEKGDSTLNGVKYHQMKEENTFFLIVIKYIL